MLKNSLVSAKHANINKPGTQKPYLYSTPDIPHTPNEKVSIDIMGPFEITSKGNRYILVIQDYLTRYILVEPLIDKSTASIIRALWYSWLSPYEKESLARYYNLCNTNIIVTTQKYYGNYT